MSTFVAVWDHEDCVTLVTVDPRHTGATVVQHPGSRHPISAGAPGIAIQSAFSEQEWNALAPGIPYRAEAAEARRRGFAASHDEVIAGVSSLAVPVRVPGGRPAALAVVYIRAAQDPDEVAAALVAGRRAHRGPAGLRPLFVPPCIVVVLQRQNDHAPGGLGCRLSPGRRRKCAGSNRCGP